MLLLPLLFVLSNDVQGVGKEGEQPDEQKEGEQCPDKKSGVPSPAERQECTGDQRTREGSHASEGVQSVEQGGIVGECDEQHIEAGLDHGSCHTLQEADEDGKQKGRRERKTHAAEQEQRRASHEIPVLSKPGRQQTSPESR